MSRNNACSTSYPLATPAVRYEVPVTTVPPVIPADNYEWSTVYMPYIFILRPDPILINVKFTFSLFLIQNDWNNIEERLDKEKEEVKTDEK